MFSSRLLAVPLLRSARSGTQTTLQLHRPRYHRSFSVSPPTRANPAPDHLTEFTAALQKTSIWKKLANHPDAIVALQDFGRALQNAGVDPTLGKPSTFKMLKLAANPEFRASITRVTEEMKKAGVDLTSPEVMEEVMKLQKYLGQPK